MTIKDEHAFTVFAAALVLIFIVYGVMLLRLVLSIRREKKWLKSLTKKDLLGLEDLLSDCLANYNINREDFSSIAEIITNSGYTIKEKAFMPLSEGYTTKKPINGVYIWKFLSSGKKHFTLAHELMHIIYMPEDLDTRQQRRRFHSLFRIRNKDEQTRDYMAASFILPRDMFWQELVEADYFNMPPDERKSFVFEMAMKYDVETPTVYRRIDELKVLNG